MVWDLNKYRRLLDPEMQFIDKRTSIILKSTCYPDFVERRNKSNL